MNKCIRTLAFFFVLSFLSFSSYAGSHEDPGPNSPAEIAGQGPHFRKGRLALQVVSGALFSPTLLTSRSSILDYAMTDVRLGWMLNSPSPQPAPWRGNFEVILEVSNAFIFKGFGHYIGGTTGLIRYNFIQSKWKFVPYFQVGAGIVYTDAYRELSQRDIGQAIEFTPQGSIGFRYLGWKNWSFDGEFMFHHISNADLADRNTGLNAAGGFLGVTYFFDKLW